MATRVKNKEKAKKTTEETETKPDDQISMLGVEELHKEKADKEAKQAAIAKLLAKKKDLEMELRYAISGAQVIGIKQEMHSLDMEINALKQSMDLGPEPKSEQDGPIFSM